MTREAAVKLVREVVERTTDVHEYHGIPAKFDPHEWVVEAVRLAHSEGVEQGRSAAFDDVAQAIRNARTP